MSEMALLYVEDAPYQMLSAILASNKEPNDSRSWTFDGDIITFEFETEINGKRPLKQIKDCLN